MDEQIKLLTEALKYYADKDNWVTDEASGLDIVIFRDNEEAEPERCVGGLRARKALHDFEKYCLNLMGVGCENKTK